MDAGGGEVSVMEFCRYVRKLCSAKSSYSFSEVLKCEISCLNRILSGYKTETVMPSFIMLTQALEVKNIYSRGFITQTIHTFLLMKWWNQHEPGHRLMKGDWKEMIWEVKVINCLVAPSSKYKFVIYGPCPDSGLDYDCSESVSSEFFHFFSVI